MAFTETWLPNQLWDEFTFYASGGTNGVITESIAPDCPWRLHELRVHLSVAFASIDDLIMRLSAAQGSAYNMTFLSYAMSGSTDVWFLYSHPLRFASDDQMVITLSLASGTNIIGIVATGWAVRGGG